MSPDDLKSLVASLATDATTAFSHAAGRGARRPIVVATLPVGYEPGRSPGRKFTVEFRAMELDDLPGGLTREQAALVATFPADHFVFLIELDGREVVWSLPIPDQN
jgi:hypothetical protein